MRTALLALTATLITTPHAVATGDPAPALPLREQAATRDAWLEHRLDTLVPRLMSETGIDMWVLIAREYNEDPVVRTMLPATWLSARRRTILVLHQPEPGAPVERLAVARYAVGDLFEGAWDPEQEPDQWARLREIIDKRDPQSIGVNVSPLLAHADGLTETEHGLLVDALGDDLAARIVSAEDLALRWLETRTEPEIAAYPALVRTARSIIHEALSEVAITPGVTTTEDLEWWLRDRTEGLGYDIWFHPSVAVQRPDRQSEFVELFTGQGETILPGDLVHIDFGITYLGLNTDTQQMAYVLRPGETAPPSGLRDAFAQCNRLQDILTSEFESGRTGNEALRRTLERAEGEGLRPSVYSHPIGYHGHAAGPAVGMWDKQEGVPGTGDLPIRPNTCWSIELNITASIPEWNGQDIRIMLEEDAVFDGTSVEYLDGRQTELLLIPRQRDP